MSSVYFSKDINKAAELFDLAGFDKLISTGEEVALKIHFGEPGNNAPLKPENVRSICEKIKNLKGKPFYTDCDTLYKGRRGNSADHRLVAAEHGFTPDRAGAEVFIPDENDNCTVEVNLKHFKKVFLGGAVNRFNTIIALTHFKGHELTGFGGALKNLGMGFGSRLGKLRMHQDCANCPEVKTCIRNKTIEACWFGSPKLVQEKIVEYFFGAVKGKKAGYLNYLINISPNCDCYPHNDPAVVANIGVMASLDPVAIDQASVDLVNQSAGRDVFREIHGVDWQIQLAYAEAIGLGSRKYELVVK